MTSAGFRLDRIWTSVGTVFYTCSEFHQHMSLQICDENRIQTTHLSLMVSWYGQHNHNSYDELLQRMVSEIACAIGIGMQNGVTELTKKQSKG